jgi:hypothetical protein
MTITEVPLLVSLLDWVAAGIGFAQPTSIVADTSEAAISRQSHVPKRARGEDESCKNIGVWPGLVARIQPSGDDPGSRLPMPRRLFEGVGELQKAQLTVVPPDNLNADGQA